MATPTEEEIKRDAIREARIGIDPTAPGSAAAVDRMTIQVLAYRCAAAEADLARLVNVIRECARDDLGTTAKSIMASNVLREIEEDRDAS